MYEQTDARPSFTKKHILRLSAASVCAVAIRIPGQRYVEVLTSLHDTLSKLNEDYYSLQLQLNV